MFVPLSVNGCLSTELGSIEVIFVYRAPGSTNGYTVSSFVSACPALQPYWRVAEVN